MSGTVTITHTHEAGTMIEGTARGDGSAEVLKVHRWRWGRSIGAWYVPHSRDRLADRYRIGRVKAALEAAGFTVEVQIDDELRSTADVEAGKIARQQARVDALDAKADRKTAAADAAWERHEHDVARLPEGGEPIKVGHHSERRHRAAIDRAHTSMRRSIDAHNAASTAADRANAAAHTTDRRYAPATVANRIEKLGADLRRLEREVTADRYDRERGYRPPTETEQATTAARIGPRAAELRDQIAYWESVRAEQIADGRATGYTRADIQKGDLVKIRGHWRRIVRANPKTVSVETGYSWTDTVPYAELQDHKGPLPWWGWAVHSRPPTPRAFPHMGDPTGR